MTKDVILIKFSVCKQTMNIVCVINGCDFCYTDLFINFWPDKLLMGSQTDSAWIASDDDAQMQQNPSGVQLWFFTFVNIHLSLTRDRLL